MVHNRIVNYEGCDCWKSVYSPRHSIVPLVSCKGESTGNMFPLTGGIEHRLLKEKKFMTENGDEARTSVGHWIKGTRERESW